MADDNTKNQARKISGALGKTLEEMRGALDRFRDEARITDQRAFEARLRDVGADGPAIAAPKIDVTTDTLQSKPVTTGGDKAPAAEGGGNLATILEDDVYFNAPDSTFYYINIHTDGRFDPI